MGTLEAIIRNEPCQPSDIITLKVQWSFRCWWASGSWTTAGERDLDDRSRTRKFPGGKETTALIALLRFLQMFFFFRWWWYNFADLVIEHEFWDYEFHGRSFWTASWGRLLMFFFRRLKDCSVGSKFVCHVRFLCSMKGWEIGGNTRLQNNWVYLSWNWVIF